MVSKALGHANTAITEKVYDHVVQTLQKQPMAFMTTLFA
jgi:integrase